MDWPGSPFALLLTVGALGLGFLACRLGLAKRLFPGRNGQHSRRLELALSGARLGYWDWNIRAGTVARSERWAEIIGYAPGEISPRLDAWAELLHPEDRERIEESARRLGEGQLAHYAAEYRLRARSGEWRWVLDTGHVVERDAEGRPTRAAGIHADITERKHLEQTLHETTSLLRAIVDTSPSMIFVVDESGRLVFTNQYAARYYGTTPEELLTKSTGDVHPDRRQADAFESDNLEVIRTGRTVVRDEANTAPDGTEHWFHTVKVPLVRPDKSIACLGLATDVTGRKRAEDALRQSATLAAVGAMVAGVAHEVRNPLFGISSTLDVLETRSGAREEFQRPFTALRHEVERLSALMHDLLELAKPPSPSTRPEPIAGIVDEGVRICEPLAAEAGVRIVQQIEPGLPRVAGERSRLVQVIQNLIANAVQHSRSGLEVTVSARVVPRHEATPFVECTVADDGTGFAPDDLPHVFEPFFSRRQRGTGLGLAIVQRIVEQHGGEVVAGNRESGGALVTLRLPAEGA
jgi:PAS domain S-box-containing protein